MAFPIFTRLNERSSRPNAYINFIHALPSVTLEPISGTGPGSSSATQPSSPHLDLLNQIAAFSQPIMQAHSLRVNRLTEHPPNAEFLGRNFNAGALIELVLRKRNSGGFYSFKQLCLVMAHELAHCRHMDHGPEFWKFCRQLEGEMREQWRRGYLGDGVWGAGRVVGTGVAATSKTGIGLDDEDLPAHLCGGTFRSAKKRTQKKTGQTGRKLGPSGRARKITPASVTNSPSVNRRVVSSSGRTVGTASRGGVSKLTSTRAISRKSADAVSAAALRARGRAMFANTQGRTLDSSAPNFSPPSGLTSLSGMANSGERVGSGLSPGASTSAAAVAAAAIPGRRIRPAMMKQIRELRLAALTARAGMHSRDPIVGTGEEKRQEGRKVQAGGSIGGTVGGGARPQDRSSTEKRDKGKEIVGPEGMKEKSLPSASSVQTGSNAIILLDSDSENERSEVGTGGDIWASRRTPQSDSGLDPDRRGRTHESRGGTRVNEYVSPSSASWLLDGRTPLSNALSPCPSLMTDRSTDVEDESVSGTVHYIDDEDEDEAIDGEDIQSVAQAGDGGHAKKVRITEVHLISDDDEDEDESDVSLEPDGELEGDRNNNNNNQANCSSGSELRLDPLFSPAKGPIWGLENGSKQNGVGDDKESDRLFSRFHRPRVFNADELGLGSTDSFTFCGPGRVRGTSVGTSKRWSGLHGVKRKNQDALGEETVDLDMNYTAHAQEDEKDGGDDEEGYDRDRAVSDSLEDIYKDGIDPDEEEDDEDGEERYFICVSDGANDEDDYLRSRRQIDDTTTASDIKMDDDVYAPTADLPDLDSILSPNDGKIVLVETTARAVTTQSSTGADGSKDTSGRTEGKEATVKKERNSAKWERFFGNLGDEDDEFWF